MAAAEALGRADLDRAENALTTRKPAGGRFRQTDRGGIGSGGEEFDALSGKLEAP